MLGEASGETGEAGAALVAAFPVAVAAAAYGTVTTASSARYPTLPRPRGEPESLATRHALFRAAAQRSTAAWGSDNVSLVPSPNCSRTVSATFCYEGQEAEVLG